MLTSIVLRDDRQQCWYQYREPVDVLIAREHGAVVGTLREVEQRVEQEGLFAAGFVCYGAAAAFDRALPSQAATHLPLLCFALYPSRSMLTSLPPAPPRQACFKACSEWHIPLAQEHYCEQVEQLRQQIGAGAIYQVNFTTRLQAQGCLDFQDFLRMAGDAPYGAFLDADDFTIVSASPELFFETRGDVIVSRPMKGTAPRGLDSSSDLQAAKWLAQSTKNRAENLMITDMVRNDLGRIAVPGSVTVPALFEVEQYPTVWQMTSTVEAKTSADVADVFGALFPGASITGAPKRAAMEIIDSREQYPREIYTGSIGVMEPGGVRRFNVAIRTAWTDKRSDTTYYGAGGGIVWDSDPAEEYAELLTKTRVLHASPQSFQLLETMRWQTGRGIYLRERHLARIARSARYFQYKFPQAAIEQRLDALEDEVEAGAGHTLRVRLLLNRDGLFQLQTSPLVENRGKGEVQPLMLAKTAVDRNDVYLYHKTSARQAYERAAGEVPAGCEALLVNQQGFVTESTIANLVYRLQGQLYTPPVADGLLAGTLRDMLLECGDIEERSLHLDEMDNVDNWYLINALRGWRTAELMTEESRVQDLLFS